MTNVIRTLAPHRIWAIIWGISLIINIHLRLRFCEIASWFWEQSSCAWQAALWIKEGQFPMMGINSSNGTVTFNTNALVTSAISIFPGGLYGASIVLTLLQIVTTLLLLFEIKAINHFNRWLIAMAVLFNPYVIGISIDNWHHSVSSNYICLILFLTLRIIRKKQGHFIEWFFLVFFISLACLTYLGNAPMVLTLLGILAYLKFKKRLIFGKKQFSYILIGSLPLIALSIVPYFYELWGSKYINLLLNQSRSLDAQPKNVETLIKILKHPWAVLVNPRNYYPYSHSKIITEPTISAFFALFALLASTYSLVLVNFIWLKFKKINICPPEDLSWLLKIWLGTAILFIVLPNDAFYITHKFNSFYVWAYILFFTTLVALVKHLPGRLNAISTVLLASLTLCSVFVGHRSVSDHLNYRGETIPMLAGVPMRDRIDAVDYIASQLPPGSNKVNIAYDFYYSDRVRHEDQYLYYVTKVINGHLLTVGLFYDTQLWLKHGIKNGNKLITDRHLGDNDYMISFSFVHPKDIRPPWTQSSNYKDFGRLRVYKDDKSKH